MQKEEKESEIQKLIASNVPFVIFKEPGGVSKLIIQNSPLVTAKDLKIDKRGFYAFPFTKKEKAAPLYFAPDIYIDYADRSAIDMKIPKLQVGKLNQQNLHVVDKEEYIKDLNKYLNAFETKQISKAIYSRVNTKDLVKGFQLEAFYERLEQRYPKAFLYVMNIPGDGLWLGASPELLLSYTNEMARTVALAGTLKIAMNLSSPEWTRKEIDEHRLVEKHIINLCDELHLHYDKSPVRTVNTGKVYHLKSDFSLRIPVDVIAKFIEKLHPTPAISGLPQKESLDLIYEVEQHDRAYYCGFLGFVNDIEEFNFYINLRCMKIIETQYSLFAGGGITPESNIDKEWEETQVKMATLTDLLPTNVDHEEISSVSC